jgi:hypothetical protein
MDNAELVNMSKRLKQIAQNVSRLRRSDHIPSQQVLKIIPQERKDQH